MKKKPTVEESLARLEEIVSKLEKADIGLEQSLALYTEGIRLSEACLKEIQRAEQIVEEHGLEPEEERP